MSWVNLNDVYVNKSGDSIAGNLSVGGALTVNDGKGSGGTYNVANEITALRDSASEITALRDSASQTNGQFKYVKDNNVGYVCYSKINNILFITIVNCYVGSGYTTLCTLPQGCRPISQIVFAISDNVAANYSYQRYCLINNNGEVIVKSQANGEYIWATTAILLNIPA